MIHSFAISLNQHVYSREHSSSTYYATCIKCKKLMWWVTRSRRFIVSPALQWHGTTSRWVTVTRFHWTNMSMISEDHQCNIYKQKKVMWWVTMSRWLIVSWYHWNWSSYDQKTSSSTNYITYIKRKKLMWCITRSRWFTISRFHRTNMSMFKP